MHSKTTNHRFMGGGGSYQYTPIPNIRTSPLNTPLRPIGKTSSQWNYQPSFDGAMRQFGANMQVRAGATKLPTVIPGQVAGQVYHAGMKSAYGYLKNPRGADGSTMMDDGIGNINMIEKRF